MDVKWNTLLQLIILQMLQKTSNEDTCTTSDDIQEEDNAVSQVSTSPLTSNMSLLPSKREVFGREPEEPEEFRKREMRFWKEFNGKKGAIVMPSALNDHTKRFFLPAPVRVRLSAFVYSGQK